MKWLLIYLEDMKSEAEKASVFLDSRNWKKEDIILSKRNAAGKIRSLPTLSSKAEAAIVISGGEMPERVNFILGILAGKGIPTFVFAEKETAESRIFSDGSKDFPIYFFKGTSSLISYIKKNARQIEIEGAKSEVRKKLFQEGISLTADSFEFYLGKKKDEKCRLILDSGLDIASQTMSGVPLLNIAIRNDNKEFTELLLKRGSDINIVAKDRGYSAIMDAVWRKNIELTRLLIKKGADLSTLSSDGQSALVLAVGNGSTKIVSLLLENGADPDVKDAMGMSAREYALLFKNKEIIRLMEKIPPKKGCKCRKKR